jgi:hypothetical protein
MTKVRVAVKFFWGGSVFYSGALQHCVAIPMEEVPAEMQDDLKVRGVAHWRFSPTPAPVRQTIETLPSPIRACRDEYKWHACRLEKTENGYRFLSEALFGR